MCTSANSPAWSNAMKLKCHIEVEGGEGSTSLIAEGLTMTIMEQREQAEYMSSE